MHPAVEAVLTTGPPEKSQGRSYFNSFNSITEPNPQTHPHPHIHTPGHLIQITIYPKNQIWSLHFLLETPLATSYPQNELLVPLRGLHRYTFPALSSSLPGVAAPNVPVPCSSSSPCVRTCCILHSEYFSYPFPAWQTPLRPSRTWLRGWASEAVRSSHN